VDIKPGLGNVMVMIIYWLFIENSTSMWMGCFMSCADAFCC